MLRKERPRGSATHRHRRHPPSHSHRHSPAAPYRPSPSPPAATDPPSPLSPSPSAAILCPVTVAAVRHHHPLPRPASLPPPPVMPPVRSIMNRCTDPVPPGQTAHICPAQPSSNPSVRANLPPVRATVEHLVRVGSPRRVRAIRIIWSTPAASSGSNQSPSPPPFHPKRPG